jgi:hypothetical protein
MTCNENIAVPVNVIRSLHFKKKNFLQRSKFGCVVELRNFKVISAQSGESGSLTKTDFPFSVKAFFVGLNLEVNKLFLGNNTKSSCTC